ncbi:MAG: hypothetical protein ACI83N_000569, partial [Hydrogenophaga sp.]
MAPVLGFLLGPSKKNFQKVNPNDGPVRSGRE